MSFGMAFLAGAVGEYNRLDEAKRAAKAKADAEREKIILEANAKEEEKLLELGVTLAGKAADAEIERDDFNFKRGLAFSDASSRRNAYKSAGVNAFVTVDSKNEVVVKEFGADGFIGFTKPIAEQEATAFTSNPINQREGHVPYAVIVPIQSEKQKLENGKPKYYNIETGFEKLPDNTDLPTVLSWIQKNADKFKTYKFTPGYNESKQTYFVKSELAEKAKKTREEMNQGVADLQNAYPDHDVFVVGSDDNLAYEFKPKLDRGKVTTLEKAEELISEGESKMPGMQGIWTRKDDYFEVSFVEKKFKLFETQDKAQEAANKAKADNPDFVYAVIGSDEKGWTIKAEKAPEEKPDDPTDDPKYFDTRYGVAYDKKYPLRQATGWDTTFSPDDVAASRVIPLTQRGASSYARPDARLKDNVLGEDLAVFIAPAEVSGSSYPDTYVEAIKSAFPYDLVRKMYNPANANDPILQDARQDFEELLMDGINNYYRGTEIPLADRIETEIPGNVSLTLQAYAQISPRLDQIVNDGMDSALSTMIDNNNGIQGVDAEVEAVSPDDPNSAIRVSQDRFPNLAGNTTLVQNNALTEGANRVVNQAALNAGFVDRTTGKTQNTKVMRLLETAEDENGYNGPAGVENGFKALENLQSFFSESERSYGQVTRGSVTVRTIQGILLPQEKEEYAEMISVFPSHAGRIQATQMAIPQGVAAARGSTRRSNSTQDLQLALTNKKFANIEADYQTNSNAVELSTGVLTLLLPPPGQTAAQLGPAAEIERFRAAAKYVTESVLGTYTVQDGFGMSAEALQNTLRTEYNNIPEGDTQNAKNALLKYLIKNLVYIQAKMNDPLGRLSEGDREQANDAIAYSTFIVSPSSLANTVGYIKERSEGRKAYLEAIMSGDPKQILSAEVYYRNYLSGRVPDVLTSLMEIEQDFIRDDAMRSSQAPAEQGGVTAADLRSSLRGSRSNANSTQATDNANVELPSPEPEEL